MSECRCPGSNSGLAAVTWAYARACSSGYLPVSCTYPRGHQRSRAVVGPSLVPLGPSTGSGAAELRITSVSRALLAEFKARASFTFTGCCLWRSLAVDGGSGTSRGHVRNAQASSCSGVVLASSTISARRP